VQGVDVGARAEIYRLVLQAARRGAGVLLISSELDQMLDLCTRVLVLRDGRLIADRPAAPLTRHQLTHDIYFGVAADASGPDADEDPGDPDRTDEESR
jgi:ribose transport system ATP-binding protein